MPTRMLCPSKCVTRASTSWPAQAPSATTASAHGAHISGRRSRTTPPNSVAGTSPAKAVPSGVRHAHAREIEVLDDGDIARWTAEHDGYASLDPPAVHRRSVLLDRASRSIDIIDQINGGSHDIRLAFHLGPDVRAELEESCAVLDWPTASTPGAARLELPPGLRWSLHRGETDPILGWYSQASVGVVPAVTLLGCGRCVPGMPLITRLEFLEVGKSGNPPFPGKPYHGPHPPPCRIGRRRSKRRPDEPAGTGPAEVHADRAAAQGPCGHRGGPGHRSVALLTPCSSRRCSRVPR